MSRQTRPPRARPATHLVIAIALSLASVPATADAQPVPAPSSQPAVVRGVVHDPDSRPIALAEVLVGDSSYARTDSAGRFTLGALPIGEVELTVRRVGFVAVSVPLTLGAGQRRNLAIELSPLSYALDPVIVSVGRPGLFGRVVDVSGAPIDGAEVRITGAGRVVTTGPDGGFAVSGIDPRTYLVRVRREGHRAAHFSVTLPAGRGQEVRVELGALPDELRGGARRLASGYGMGDDRRLEELESRIRVNRLVLVPRLALSRAGKRDVASVISHDLPAMVPMAEQHRIPSPSGSIGVSEAPVPVVMRGVQGACYFVDGDYALDQTAARSMPVAWLESVEIMQWDDTGTLTRRLPAGADWSRCAGFVVLWTRR